MNVIDFVVYLVLALAVWDGWRRGVVLQLCSLAGIVAGVWLAARFGVTVGGWFRLEEGTAQAVGFVAVLVLTVLGVALLGRVVRKIFRFAGFGVPDILLGIAVSVVKYVLLLSVLFAALGRIDPGHALIGADTVRESRWYAPVASVSEHIFPFIHWVGEQLPTEK